MLRSRGSLVLVKPLARKALTEGGIVLPDTRKRDLVEGIVIKFGPGVYLESGTRGEITDMNPGDRVLYKEGNKLPVELDHTECILLNDRDIVAVFSEETDNGGKTDG